MMSQITTESRGKLCVVHEEPVQAIPMPSGRGVGTLIGTCRGYRERSH